MNSNEHLKDSAKLEMSTYREIVSIAKVADLLSFAFTRNEMQKMQWKKWTELLLMAGN